MLNNFLKFWNNLVRCWREGHEWTDSEIKRIYGTKYSVKYCERCHITDRGARIIETLETPLEPEDLRGIIFCNNCGINACYTEDEAEGKRGVVISEDRIYCNDCDTDLLLLKRGDQN